MIRSSAGVQGLVLCLFLWAAGCSETTTQVIAQPNPEIPDPSRAWIVVGMSPSVHWTGNFGAGWRIRSNGRLVGTLGAGGQVSWVEAPGGVQLEMDSGPFGYTLGRYGFIATADKTYYLEAALDGFHPGGIEDRKETREALEDAQPLPNLTGPRVKIAVAGLVVYGIQPADVGGTLTELLRNELADTGYFDLINREDMDEILKEQQFQGSGACDTTEGLVKIGKILGVKKMVGGSVGQIDDTFNIGLKLVDVETARNERLVDKQFRGKPSDLFMEMKTVAKRLARRYAQTTP